MKVNVPSLKSVVLAGILLACWVGTRNHSTAAQQQPRASNAEIQGLLQARAESADKALETEKRKMEMGKSTLEWIYIFARRALNADLEASATSQDQLAARTKHYTLMKELEEKNTVADAQSSARYWRLNAEIELARAKLGPDTTR